MNITLYTKANCPQCTATKRQLDKRGLPYTTVDITANARISDRCQSSSQTTNPGPGIVPTKSTSWRLAAGERVGVLLVGIGQYDTLRRRMPIG